MRIGILKADTVLDEFQAEHGDYPQMFLRLLAQAQLDPEQFVIIDAQAETLPPITIADCYLITGSKHSVYDDLPWIPRLAEFVGEALADARKVVGICFGHQLLAHFFGGLVEPAEQGWRVGVNVNEVVAIEHWMRPQLRQYATLSSHQDQVQKMPPGAKLVASHPACPVAAFVLPQGALAIQGHPEFQKPYARALLATRELRVGAGTFQAGMASFAEPTTSTAVAHWVCNFLGSSTSE